MCNMQKVRKRVIYIFKYLVKIEWFANAKSGNLAVCDNRSKANDFILEITNKGSYNGIGKLVIEMVEYYN